MHVAAAQETPPRSLSSSLTTAAVINVSLYSGQKTTSYNAQCQKTADSFPFKQAEYIFNLSSRRNGKKKKTNTSRQDT